MGTNIANYYDSITSVDIGRVATELFGGRITERTSQRILCDCPNHGSESKKALSISLDKQMWYCFGCGVGGDVLHLVEFAQSGSVSKNLNGSDLPDSHKQARDWLAPKAGLNKLSEMSLDSEQIASIEAERKKSEQVREVLKELANTYCSILLHKDNVEVLKWFSSKYAISVETIKNFRIGYSAEDYPVVDMLKEKRGYSSELLVSTGAYRKGGNKLYPFFNNRIVFPYWQRGSVVFMAGRKTPWTPDNKYESGKYKKLPVYNSNDIKKEHLAKCVDNSVLVNESCLMKRPKSVIITEGITDCIALIQRGFDAISPATVRISNKDWGRILPKLRTVNTVYFCQDNEKSGVGLQGALDSAEKLIEAGIDTKIINLPLPEGEGKIDVNQYFLNGATEVDFQELIEQAQMPLELVIEALPVEKDIQTAQRELGGVLRKIAVMPTIVGSFLLKKIQQKFGKNLVSLTEIKVELKQLRTRIKKEREAKIRQEVARENKKTKDELKERNRVAQIKEEFGVKAPEGSCRRCIEEAILEGELKRIKVDEEHLVDICMKWFLENGASFYRTKEGSPYMYYNSKLYWLSSLDPLKRKIWLALMFKLTGFSVKETRGRLFIDIFELKVITNGKIRDISSFLKTDLVTKTIYFNLHNGESEIVKISPDNIEILKNGNNDDNIFLDESDKFQSFNFDPHVNLKEASDSLYSLFSDYFACSVGSRFFITYWFISFLFKDFSEIMPILYFGGDTGIGKSTATKMLSILLYGKEEQKVSTVAANFTDASKSPVLFLDNLETKDINSAFKNFLLVASTGINNEKRKLGTNSEIISEKVKCLINVTAVDPLCPELPEAINRIFTVIFSKRFHKGNQVVTEASVTSDTLEKRDIILSGVIVWTSKVLALLEQGRQREILLMMNNVWEDHTHKRCNSYLSLMYLMMLATEPESDRAVDFKELNVNFSSWMQEVSNETAEAGKEADSIGGVLNQIMILYKLAKKGDTVGIFAEKYAIWFNHMNESNWMRSSQLHATMKRVSRDFGMTFNISNPAQLGKRLSSSGSYDRVNIEIRKDNHSKCREYKVVFL